MLACTNVITLAKVAFLFVPPAASSTMIKSAVAKSAPISVPPSMQIVMFVRVRLNSHNKV